MTIDFLPSSANCRLLGQPCRRSRDGSNEIAARYGKGNYLNEKLMVLGCSTALTKFYFSTYLTNGVQTEEKSSAPIRRRRERIWKIFSPDSIEQESLRSINFNFGVVARSEFVKNNILLKTIVLATCFRGFIRNNKYCIITKFHDKNKSNDTYYFFLLRVKKSPI